MCEKIRPWVCAIGEEVRKATDSLPDSFAQMAKLSLFGFMFEGLNSNTKIFKSQNLQSTEVCLCFIKIKRAKSL